MKQCESCVFRLEIAQNRIDCENSTASPRTESYPGSGAHPLGFDPAIVLDCDGWESMLPFEPEPGVLMPVRHVDR